MKVLVACEFSGVVRRAFRERGHDAWSCDLVSSLDHSRYHIKDDALYVARNDNWDLMIAHPECRFLSNSGVKHLYINGRKENGREPIRWGEMQEAALFFVKLLNMKHIPKRCIENPVQHRYTKQLIRVEPSQSVQPWMFGHGEIKRTCFWLVNLPLLKATNVVDGRVPRVHYESPGMKNGLTRSQRRSIFFPGIADAMAEQWGNLGC